MSAVTAVKPEDVYQINDLNLWYGEHHALKNINLTIPEYEITAIIGPSGCGKSTFIKTLNLMINMVPNVKMTGEISYNGTNVLNSKVDLVELRKKVGMVFQKETRFPSRSLIMSHTDQESMD